MELAEVREGLFPFVAETLGSYAQPINIVESAAVES